jgi:transcription elongation factor B subunit 1
MIPCAGSFIENEQGEIRFPEITTPVLEVVCKYFYYKVSGSCR